MLGLALDTVSKLFSDNATTYFYPTIDTKLVFDLAADATTTGVVLLQDGAQHNVACKPQPATKAARGTRTHDLCFTKALLYQLSYSGGKQQ